MKRLKTFTDERGSLTVAETGKDLPFEVKRAYWIFGVPEGHERGTLTVSPISIWWP